jgi:EAL domain-containing protein (putative c-di-GMP-specific phosphodiesterase class I)
VILCAEIRLQIIQNSTKLKYSFKAVVLMYERYSYFKGVTTRRLYYKPIGDIIKNKFVYLGGLMRWRDASNDRKLQ